MNEEKYKCLQLLTANKNLLTGKQKKILRGHITSRNYEAFRKGLSGIIEQRYNRCRHRRTTNEEV